MILQVGSCVACSGFLVFGFGDQGCGARVAGMGVAFGASGVKVPSLIPKSP